MTVAPKDLTKDTELLLREKYAGKETPAFFQDVLRLKSGEPLDYVIGFTPFLGCHIDLSSEPLIPRTETEFWTEEVIERLRERESLNILDIYAGSGCIGIAVLKHVPNSTVDFAELDWEHVKQIKKNLRLNNITSKRTHLYQGDSFTPIPKKKKYDVILANPPYVSYERKNNVTNSVQMWEPEVAVFAGDHGFDLIKTLLSDGANYLKPNGTMYIEFDSPQHDALEEFISDTGQFDAIFHKDQFGAWRYVELIKRDNDNKNT